MEKISYLFQLNESGSPLVCPVIEEAEAWALTEDTKATVMWDGVPILVEEGAILRHDSKSVDGWTMINPKRAQDKAAAGAWRRLAIELGCFEADAPVTELFQTAAVDALAEKVQDGTYELVGPGIMGNHQSFDEPTLVRHGYGQVDVQLKGLSAMQAFLACHKALLAVYCEGIVFHREASNVPDSIDDDDPSARMVKVTREDFGIPWPDPAMVAALEQRAQEAQRQTEARKGSSLRLVGSTGAPLS